MKKVSIIIPCYNEELVFFLLYQTLKEVVSSLMQYRWEFVFIDDGSQDKTWQLIMQAAEDDVRIKGIKLSRNFGHQKALAAGYAAATGDALISIDADLQDPPELIRNLVQKWQEGYAIVYARRTLRSDGFVKKITAQVYYWLLNYVASCFIPRSVGDYRLIDKKVLQQFPNLQEAARYWRGTVAWTGLSYAFVDFVRKNREHGSPGYTWKKSLHLALDGLMNFSFFPLQFAGYMSALLAMISTTISFYSFVHVLTGSSYLFTHWIGVLILWAISIQLFCVWMIGEYIGRIYQNNKQWPLYVVAETKGIEDEVYVRANSQSTSSINRL